MKYMDAPTSVRALEQRIRNVEKGEELALRRRITMALVVVGQMLPEGAVKGGSAMALRVGRSTRFTRDLDAARVKPLADFRRDFEKRLLQGWAGFSGRLVERAAPSPALIPAAYVMQPFDIKLDYRGRSWCTVKFELGHNEIDDAHDPLFLMPPEISALFAEVGLPAPQAIPVMRTEHQIAQKLHALSAPGSERARDLVDLQLLDKHENLDMEQVAVICERLFHYRRQQLWPPSIDAGTEWATLYAEAAENCDVLPHLGDAIAWTRNFVERIAAASNGRQK